MAKSIAQKLLIKSGYTVRFINEPDGYSDTLGNVPENVTIKADAKDADLVHLFVESVSELESFASSALEAVKDDGLLWISYPKKSSGVKTDISRDGGWDVIDAAAYRPVTQISIDDTWSALRFRQKDKVGT